MTRMRAEQFSETMIVRSRGRLLARVLAVLVAAAILAQLAHTAFARELAGSEAPDFVLKSTTGANRRLSEYRSEVVVLAFWASWCGACRDGLAGLERLQQSLGADGLRVLAVSFDRKPEAATEAAARLSFPMLVDADGSVGRLYDVGKLPTVVVVDREGRVHSRHAGAGETGAAGLETEIRALLRQ